MFLPTFNNYYYYFLRIFYFLKESIIKESLCKWREIFNRAQHLEKNWKTVIYFVAPILKGHRGAVSSFDSNGLNTYLLNFLNVHLLIIYSDVKGSIAVSSCNNDKLIKVWSIQDLECNVTFKAKSDSVNSIKLLVNIKSF